jgi:hypothetical protein
MALEILASFIPTSVGGAIGLLVQILIIWVVVMLADKIIAHQMQAKHSLILAILAYFLSPLVLAFAAISIPFASIIVPLIVWIVLGEILLRGYGGAKARLKVAAIAFVIYLVLNYAGVPGMIAAAIGI